jgi:hypothetical protein
VFLDATKKANGIHIDTTPSEQAQRMEETAPNQRVANPAALPRVQTTTTNKVPHLIPADDNDIESSDNELCNDKDEDQPDESPPKYQLNQKRQRTKPSTAMSQETPYYQPLKCRSNISAHQN